jgi:hypothetical protein
MVEVKWRNQDCWVSWILDVPIEFALRREE